MKIKNCKDLISEWIGAESVEDSEERSKQLLEKWVFKYTECGCIFNANEDGISVGGYAEGSDAELEMYDLDWGFTIDEFHDALGQADLDGSREWHLVNDEHEIGGEG
tara:strand:- start:941 stop:1261 length:321 start_codon:yes stop_codon:yes gene_type:complete